MIFNFNKPLLLLLIPFTSAFVMLTSRNLIRAGGWRKEIIITIRITVLMILILCIAGFGIKKVTDRTTSIFLIDGSDSTYKFKEHINEFIRDSIKSKKPSDWVGIVNFGENAAVEMSPTQNPVFSSMQTNIKSSFTNIEGGLKLASSLIPSGDRKRIVLVTDSLENVGDSLKQARLLKQQNIALDILPLGKVQDVEVQASHINIPETLYLNEKFQVVVKIDSTIKTEASLKLYADRELTAEKIVELHEGENKFTFSDVANKGGLLTYSAIIEADNDTISKNNKVSSFSYIEDIAQVLIIQDEDEWTPGLLEALESDVRLKIVKPENIPVSLDELQKFDAFIISNVSAERLDDRFLHNLESCIKYQAKGLLVTGGENSYAPGGYFKTPLEKVLPVYMDIKPDEEHPNLGLVLVIDKSGSMSQGQYGVSKVELAKEAAIRSTEVLKQNDMIGVIAFDNSVQWVVKTQQLDNLKAIQDAIGTIRADGGTQILHPLEEAYLSLKDADTKLKHIILLTDGQAEKTGYQSLIENINNAGITLSTVAIGQSADASLLEFLAAVGNGRFYMTDAFSDIPSIFVKETFLAGKTYLNNRTFTPSLQSYSDILRNIEAVPFLDGYVATTPKNTARVILSSDRDEPILATWQYGLGRTAAWTPDVKGMWTGDWIKWEQYPHFWKNTISWLIQKNDQSGYTIRGNMEAGTGILELTLPPDSSLKGESIEAVILDPSGKEQKIALEAASPGFFRGSFNADTPGVYITILNVIKDDTVVKSINSGIIIPYSPEYNITQSNTDTLIQKLSYATGGRILDSADQVFFGDAAPVISITDMTPFLLVLAIILLLIDIVIRRLNLQLEKVKTFFEKAEKSYQKLSSSVVRPMTHRVGKKADDISTQKSDASSGLITQASNTKENKAETQADYSHISILLERKRKRGSS